MPTIALLGNPNSGKSTLFTTLTGSRQRVGNWPGVTVEKKTGSFSNGSQTIDVIDLPGLYDLHKSDVGPIDEQIVSDYLEREPPDVIVNVVDSTTLARSLFLTTQLRELNIPILVCLNMVDVATRNKINIDIPKLANTLQCQVIPMVASRGTGVDELRTTLNSLTSEASIQTATHVDVDVGLPERHMTKKGRYDTVDNIVNLSVTQPTFEKTWSSRIDSVVLNRFLAFPLFLLVMYMMFLFTINVGSAFIDFFDILGQALFVDGPRLMLAAIGLPNWLIALICDGVGGGIQLVCTFIPVIVCLFLFLAVLEDCGYMGRVAFILDRLMQKIGLPGKSFVPLIIGFGCNVPAVMGTRNLDNTPDRILTTIMAPYMSCGARLTVFALFAAAFFPSGGQNIIFGLYLLGILVAIGSAWIVRKRLLPNSQPAFTLELPSYHLPTIRGVLTQTWFRLSSFLLRAGKAIVLVVIVLNFVNSIGKDGTYGNQDSENSILAEIGKTITPVFAPMGISSENWAATVGIFTGAFAKEVVVGTLDALYTQNDEDLSDFTFSAEVSSALTSIPANLAELGDAFLDPLGMNIPASDSLASTAEIHQVEINTITAMRSLFGSSTNAFSYLVFILLYMPCVATIAAIYKEIGRFWAVFSTVWSLVIAYCASVFVFQVLSLTQQPLESLFHICWVLILATIMFGGLLWAGKKHVARQPDLILVKSID